MFTSEYKNENSAAHKTIQQLRLLLERRRVTFNKDGPRLVFMCGANKSNGSLSARRAALIEFITVHAPGTKIIIAEKFFEYLHERSKKNLYDIEETLSEIADYIIIILESESAFCELGAFANKTIRHKVLIINNSKFIKTESFINLGPISAIKEANIKPFKPILWYPMSEDGIEYLDGIGAVYTELINIFKAPQTKRVVRFGADDLSPHKSLDKPRLFFIHDLIYFASPLTHASLIDLMKVLFGDGRDYAKSTNEALTLLNALGLANYRSPGAPISTKSLSPFFNYSNCANKIHIGFQMIRLRNKARKNAACLL